MTRATRIVGIDPGVTTGFAVWCVSERALTAVASMPMVDALRLVQTMHGAGSLQGVVIEDARLRKWFAPADARQARSGAGIREGIGSVKRDCQLWQDWADRLVVPLALVPPSANRTKLTAAEFERITGWTGRTNEHARDAAMLVFQRNRLTP